VGYGGFEGVLAISGGMKAKWQKPAKSAFWRRVKWHKPNSDLKI
jgi:hypothetical protein